jgi:hypothetical protein
MSKELEKVDAFWMHHRLIQLSYHLSIKMIQIAQENVGGVTPGRVKRLERYQVYG